MERSYIASQKGLSKATKEFRKKGWTQQTLADLAECSRPVVSNFFKGKPIDKQKFIGICQTLTLDWEEIVEWKTGEIEISQLVAEIRASVRESVEQECGTMRVLDMTRPIKLNDIYTQVNILEKIIGRRRFNLEQLLKNSNLEDFDRMGLGRIQQKRVLGLEAVTNYRKLMILGKPGVGKTTFLKYLAIQCNRGKFAKNLIPIFIPLKKFAETPSQPDLSKYLNEWFRHCNVMNAAEKGTKILSAGQGLILLDGLDEVREEDSQRVIREIESFHQSFPDNQFAITCRIAAREYTFEHFTEVEVADFDELQIKNFVNSWFAIKELEDYPKHFIAQLEANPTIQELANNPLLLTLLCLEFEDSGNFPSDRADLYARATNTLLRKWDDKRHIYREQIYKELNPKRKEGLLSQIAFETFDKKEYFFRQRTIERYIGEYICNLPKAPVAQDALEVDSQAVLKSIEAQHGLLVERARGIYSFSHLTFQEYFTARKIATISNPKDLEFALVNLAGHVTKKRWREVFLLTTGILEPADRLLELMKKEIDLLVDKEPAIQKLLSWATAKADSVNVSYKIAAIRAFSLSRSRSLDLEFSDLRSRAFKLSRSLKLDFSRANSLDLDFSRALSLDLDFSRSLDIDFSQSLSRSLSQFIEKCENQELKLILEKLQRQLPNPEENVEYWRKWWQNNGQAWTEEIKTAIIEYRNIGHNWKFNEEQINLLNQYLTANQLLVDCLNSECYVSREVREEIENTLLLPIELVQK
ncbi:MAG: NACHT domain-containing NTPase [Cyanobacteria bacterium P01_F01_bin.143]